MKSYNIFKVFIFEILVSSIFTSVFSCDVGREFDNNNDLVFINFECYNQEIDSDKISKTIANNPNIKTLGIEISGVNQKLIETISTLKNLEKLTLVKNVIIGELDFEPLKKLKNFNTLNMDFGKNKIKNIDKIVSIKKFEINGGTPTQQNLEEVFQLPNLESLTVYDIENINELKWNSIKNLKLKNLYIYGKQENVLYAAKDLKTLTYLEIHDINIDKNVIEVINSFTNLEKLIFKYCNIKSLNGIEKLENIDTLNFFDCDIESISGIEKLKNLDTLIYNLSNLNNNILKTISKNPNLRNLELIDCKTKNKVDLTSLENLKNLNKLTIDDWKIDQQNIDAIAKITNLEELHFLFITFDNIENLDSFKNLKKLKSFINEFPTNDKKLIANIDKFTTLQNLYLEIESQIKTNDIEKIENLKNLEQLTLKLYIYNNKFEGEINSLKSLHNLKNITLYGFKFKEFPQFLTSLTDLKYIDLEHNEISKIPDSISKIKNLEYLNLADNKFTTIPESLNNLPKLKYISFSNNIDLKGKILTNDNLEYCNYKYENYDVIDGVCKTKDMKCISNVMFYTLGNGHNNCYPQSIRYCESSDEPSTDSDNSNEVYSINNNNNRNNKLLIMVELMIEKIGILILVSDSENNSIIINNVVNRSKVNW
ncbi:L domain-like protein [Neocallimastix californiae]|uniref:L domain-like protein n=1 Tax=Neocallimastix californiae TaxID=1754190 RepID=A0A1Y2AG10_9FUNG|nr:L domain-like protein [Neocallimastix californiae]|eukprot:ORY21436.1 L domain-like protein [Neocallimastix californiae]